MLSRIKSFNSQLTRILKVDINYLMRGGTFLTLTQLSSALIGFILTIYFAKYLPQDIYGTYRYILSAYALISIAALPGIDTAIIETVSKGNHGALRYSVITKFKWGLLGALASLGVSAYNFYTGDVTLGYVFVLLAIFLPFMESLSLYYNFLNAQKRYGFWALTEFANQILSLITLFTVIYFTDDILILISTYFLTYIFIRLIITIYVLRNFVENENIDHTFIDYGKTMSWYQIITRGISSIDQMVLFHFMGPAQVAVFSIANAIPTRMQSVFKISGTLAFPKYANQSEKQIISGLNKKMLLFGLGIFACSLVYAYIAPFFFEIFFPKYLESIPYTQLVVFFTLSGITYPFSSYLGAHKKVKENYFFAVLSFVVKIISLIVLVPIYGIWGAVWGVLLSSWSTIIATYILIYKSKKYKED